MTRQIIYGFRWLTWAFGKAILAVQLVIIGSALILLAMLAESREPPLTVLPHGATVVHAGAWAEINIPVRRDLSRRCSATYSRRIMDADGSRFDLIGGHESPDGIRRIEAASPGMLRLMILMPPLRNGAHNGIDLGPAQLITTRTFVCNPSQSIWPITQTTITPLEVRP